MRTIVATLKFLAFSLLTIILVPFQAIVMLFSKGKAAYILPCLWQKLVCKIFCIKIVKNGTPNTEKQTIFVSNHISYLDIPAIGSIIKASFVAKRDVASWPVFGFLSKLQQTAFISREKSDARLGKNALDAMLRDGKSLIIFPEGTSTDGRSVYPFKSSLFSVAMNANNTDINVQPFTLEMLSVDNHAIETQNDRDLYSWHLNMDTPLDKHLWRFAKSKGANIRLTFHQSFLASNFSDRKTLAKACHDAVSGKPKE